MGFVVLQAIWGGDDFRAYGNEHLLVEGYAEELTGNLRHLAGCVQQNLSGKSRISYSILNKRFANLEALHWPTTQVIEI